MVIISDCLSDHIGSIPIRVAKLDLVYVTLAQLEEHFATNEKVTGSNPVGGSSFKEVKYWSVLILVIISDCLSEEKSSILLRIAKL